ncbi:MAG: MotA/TolQ/ExbB proton channel family protein [Pirellulales bacterium]|nr:MotA/TolQ/ExbB proton channel family protein [Pirellulales bacterium]
MTNAMVELFYVISQALLAPVMLLVVVATMLVIVVLGQAVREAVERKIGGPRWRTFLQGCRGQFSDARGWQQAAKVGLLAWLAKNSSGANTTAGELSALLPQAELWANRHLTRLQVLARVGPMLGLAGTLIPLGPALQGLSSSNLSEVGSNLNIAFTTTVLGIVVGGAAYALYCLYRGWYERDLTEFEYLLSLFEEKHDGDEASPALESGSGRRSTGRHGEPVRSVDRGGCGADHRPD